MGDEGLEAALDAAREGDEAGVNALYQAFQPPLLRYLRWRSPGGAEDLAQETWLAVARGLPRFEGGVSEFRAWLFAIARRKLVDEQRAALRRPRSEPWPARDEPGTLVLDPGQDPGDLVAGELDAQRAVAALTEHLSEEVAEVVVLRVVAGLSVEQVAALTGRSPGAIRVLQHRALRKLARALGPTGSLEAQEA
ncbi:RNA polymerase sigma factor [Aciditerrimonas ferrireducens]|uniref:RNA polymerase sigma factor n=1 Tax=Aciditerrimonas ferrireducens TaxID=667306 RepID=UPI0020055F77|nr:RNA polymerase sigma factor [Aciditerrimonas ferrireducens]MCK4176065.1 RNA polymerase sigma factor [Aciditerrimonas ferrireducens]